MLSSFIGVVYVGISLAFVYVCKMLMDIATGDVQARMEVYVAALLDRSPFLPLILVYLFMVMFSSGIIFGIIYSLIYLIQNI